MIKHFSKAFLVVLSSLVLFIFASCTTTDATYSLELTTTELTMHVGDEIDMTARLLKNGEEVNETLTWVSSDTSIVTIEGAKIKAISLGRTTIKVSFKAIEKSV